MASQAEDRWLPFGAPWPTTWSYRAARPAAAAGVNTLHKEEVEAAPKDEKEVVPAFGTLKWLHYWSQFEGQLPSPIDVSITGSMVYLCPELKWYNFDVYPHKIKLTNTGYTLLLGAKWKTERPYLEGGCFMERHVISQMHFHWGADMTEGSDHTVDKRRYPGEMQGGCVSAEHQVVAPLRRKRAERRGDV
ncbi:hypothetical protein MSG28_003006 [Choristoneura fumiferana]|uniref:Uncharacterized protein n=1 Tax=Choristoneura fumiferana TaxID=7141 RepID=A0ACC0JKA3_CHOFU|nr:hypothetical protein MSG28_003006 [Choristoneura fumiferana]